mmetsp:Transcript_70760/g.133665  ORF Transcript_70760/g.133665 Transcript_70760/m.133665 type:complete len:471 (-) Transcript_70760:201-1613(-)
MGCACSNKALIKEQPLGNAAAVKPRCSARSETELLGKRTILAGGPDFTKRASAKEGRPAPAVHAGLDVDTAVATEKTTKSGVEFRVQPSSCSLGHETVSPQLKNSAFVFIKPHAVNDKVKSLVRESFEAAGIKVASEGTITAQEISDRQLIDQHYYSIASKATMSRGEELTVPKISFQDKFGVEWDKAIASGRVLNAMEACDQLELDAAELAMLWNEAKAKGNVTKFGGGFYCGKLTPQGKGAFYIFNGFFMAMRSKFVAPGASIHYFVTEWEASHLDWGRFRSKVLGPTDPSAAPVTSLRGTLFANWRTLGLSSEPNTIDNGIHASASPFESLTERMNWLGVQPENDLFGQQLLNSGISVRQIEKCARDPKVRLGPSSAMRSLFDVLEDKDANECLNICQAVFPPSQSNTPVNRVPLLRPTPLSTPRKPLADAVDCVDQVPRKVQDVYTSGDMMSVCCRPSVVKSQVFD